MIGPRLLELHSAAGPIRDGEGPRFVEPAPESANAPPAGTSIIDAADDALAEWGRSLNGASQEFGTRSLSWLLYASLGCSGEKGSAGRRYPVWCNPTSGNLHTVEADIWVRGGLHRYDSLHHRLELLESTKRDASSGKPLIALSLVYSRQIQKYGLRGIRYAWIDLGHAISAVDIAARSLGWHMEPVCDPEIEARLGWSAERRTVWDRRRGELLCVHTCDASSRDYRVSHDVSIPMPLASADTKAAREEEWICASEAMLTLASMPDPIVYPVGQAQRQRRRRSAGEFAVGAPVSKEAFEGVLDMLATTHTDEALVLVHRVDGLSSGAYLWRPSTVGTDANLYVLLAGDIDEMAVGLHGYQTAALNHAFSITFGLRLDTSMNVARYRAAHVEAGIATQRLYLAAHGLQLACTGIGALLDEELAGFAALRDFAPLYSFACGIGT